MKAAIYKYPLSLRASSELTMPAPGRIVHVAMQAGDPYVWAIVWPDCGETITRKLRIIGTGHEYDPTGLTHIATFQQPPFVWHVFEEMT